MLMHLVIVRFPEREDHGCDSVAYADHLRSDSRQQLAEERLHARHTARRHYTTRQVKGLLQGAGQFAGSPYSRKKSTSDSIVSTRVSTGTVALESQRKNPTEEPARTRPHENEEPTGAQLLWCAGEETLRQRRRERWP